ncbi:MAG: GNAT family N-acetyltransferase [Acidimicrobiales bacterium]
MSEITSVTPALIEALRRLVPQLSTSSPAPGADELEELCLSEVTTLLIATDDRGVIIGTLTLALFRVPTGLRAWIEDVVVDSSARGAGVGASLVVEAVERAERAGARSVDLTSRPSREEANRLYRRLGFSPRSTNVYRWNADSIALDGSDSETGGGTSEQC